MRNNSVIIATNADFLADILRDTLRDFGVGAVLLARDENELMTRMKTNPRCVFLEHCFRGPGTEEFIQRMVKRNRDMRIAVWSASVIKPVRDCK
jgi:hypothetical protein